MKLRKTAVFLALVLILSGFAASYAGSGSGADTPVTECNDGKDNDGDGKVDENDPGCTKPYYKDDTEGNFYDLDASWVFSGKSAPDNGGPSAFFGSAVYDTGLPSSPLEDEVLSDNTINETYVKESTKYYGAGNISWVELTLGSSNDGQTTDQITGKGELVDDPGPYDCGNSKLNAGEDTLDCPEDAGLPDDGGNSDANTVSDVLPTVDSGTGTSSDDTDDDVKHDMDLEAWEFTTVGLSDSGGSQAGDYYDDVSGSTGDKTVTLSRSDNSQSRDAWKNAPDFYLGSENQIQMMYPEVTGDSKIGEVTDYDLKSNSVNEKDYSGSTDGSEYTSCTASSDASCSVSQSNVEKCWEGDRDSSPTEYDDKTLDKDVEHVLTDSSSYYTTSKDGNGGTVDSPSSTAIELVVDADDKTSRQDWGTVSYKGCSKSEKDIYSCNNGSFGSRTGCGYEKTSYYTGSSVSSYDTYTSDTITYRYNTIEIKKDKLVFDTNPSESPGTAGGSSSTSIPDPEKAFFDGDSFKGSSWQDSMISSLSPDGDRGYYSWKVSYDSKSQGNDPAVSVSRFKLNVNSDNDFISVRDWWRTFDADGPGGHGDGFIAIEEGSGIIGKTPATLQNETEGGDPVDFVSESGAENQNNLGCPGDKTLCVASLDLSLENFDNWDSRTPDSQDVGYDLIKKRLNASYGVCRLFKNVTPDSVSCDPDVHGDREDEPGAVCGDEPNEWTAFMEGPEVNDTTLDRNEIDQEGCITEKTQCVLKGQAVNEGTVADVSSDTTSDYETGGDSPDMEVCLAIPETGDTNIGDNIHDLDGDGDYEDLDDDGQLEPGEYDQDNDNDADVGGEWYDLDNETVNEYLRSGGSDLIDTSSDYDSNGDGTYDEEDIDYYVVENPNSYHPEYNPGGENTSIALEDDCGPDLEGCDDAGDLTAGKEPLFYSTFEEGDRDDDYNPYFENSEPADQEPYFTGYVNKIEDDSNQLEDSMDTLVPPGDPNWKSAGLYERSISNTSIDQYAITSTLSKAISTRGGVYSPGNVYLREGISERTTTDDASQTKTSRVFGNSFVDVATHSDSSKGIKPGDGVWIDPDYVKKGWENGDYRDTNFFGGWRDKLSYRMDLTGPDSGLGFDTGGGGSYEHLSTGSTQTDIVIGDIYFEGEADGVDNDGNDGADEPPSSESYEGTDIVGETTPRLEPPMCGDDRKEFLIEEMGESTKPLRYDGGYACADSVNTCVDMSATQRIVDSGTYRNVDEPGEDRGRAKNDAEICGQTSIRGSGDQKYRWLDQDLQQQYCRANSYYGEQAVRWFSSDYVDQYPEAVENGIDDDWNPYMDQQGKSTVSSPVDNGVPQHSKIRTKGFCGGDDDGEFYVTQRCSSSLCETDTDVRGMVSTPGACILDESKYSAVSGNDRDTYQPGEAVTFDYGGGETRKMRCLEGRWHDKWPIVAEVDSTEIVLGDTGVVSYYVVNPTSESKTFDLQIEDSRMQSFSEFQTSGTNSMTLTVAARSSQRVDVDAVGGREDIDNSPVTVQATDAYSDLTGEASTYVDVIPQPTAGNAENPNDVPGIGIVQLLVMSLAAASALFVS